MSLGSFGEVNFGRVELGDARRTRRLVQTADRMVQHPGGTLPDKLNHPAELKALYRLVDQEPVTHAAVLAQHRELVRQRMRACSGDVLLLHDSTELDYTGKTTLDSLGYVGKGHRNRGYICHHSLAVAAGTREVLGLASQILHCRPGAAEHETRQARRQKPDRESRLWQQGCEACDLSAVKGREACDLSAVKGREACGPPAANSAAHRSQRPRRRKPRSRRRNPRSQRRRHPIRRATAVSAVPGLCQQCPGCVSSAPVVSAVPRLCQQCKPRTRPRPPLTNRARQ